MCGPRMQTRALIHKTSQLSLFCLAWPPRGTTPTACSPAGTVCQPRPRLLPASSSASASLLRLPLCRRISWMRTHVVVEVVPDGLQLLLWHAGRLRLSLVQAAPSTITQQAYLWFCLLRTTDILLRLKVLLRLKALLRLSFLLCIGSFERERRSVVLISLRIRAHGERRHRWGGSTSFEGGSTSFDLHARTKPWAWPGVQSL